VIKTLVHINETLNKTVVMVTHDPKMASYGKKTFFLKDGVILDSLIKKESNEKYYEKIISFKRKQNVMWCMWRCRRIL